MEKLPLTKEELDKLEENLSRESFEFYKRQFDQQLEMFPETTKLIDCQHELVFSMTVNVLEQDQEGKNLGSSEIRTNTYHIPVPSGNNYQEYIGTFMQHFEKSMITAADITDKQLSESNNNE